MQPSLLPTLPIFTSMAIRQKTSLEKTFPLFSPRNSASQHSSFMITFSRAQLLVHLLRLPLSERMEPSVSFNFEAALGLVPGGYDANYATFLEMVHPQDR